MTTYEQIYYSLPASDVAEGMSTNDGKDIVEITTNRQGLLVLTVYTPRSDNLQQDEINREHTENRWYEPNERVNLAVYSDTKTNGSTHPNAVIIGRETVTLS
ncbi:hypothetical protein [Nocardia salmonicida]|uniref:hypothetical protein n=1 Tax=Nocardia salmonicida TaxID=53431 RepID=UPI000A547560|nr:hypothetical protein [Nocardia salmonicida]MBC7303182.1 hypothetical protein [Nocardia sp.]